MVVGADAAQSIGKVRRSRVAMIRQFLASLALGLLVSRLLPGPPTGLSAAQTGIVSTGTAPRLAETAVELATGAEPDVTVTGHDCRGRDFRRSGFAATVGNERGIITTLHAVVGCRSVSARIASATASNLLVTMVDVSRDVVFLTSGDVLAGPLPGSAPTPVNRPAGMRAAEDRSFVVDLRRAPVAELASIVSADDLATLRERRSPDPRITIYAATAAGAPEIFGAPVFDAAGAIVGMRNGITRATGPTSWVVPLDEIDWMPPVQNETAMDRLAALTTLLW
jgi:hypothetical protein